MGTVRALSLLATFLLAAIIQVDACCPKGDQSEFCDLYNSFTDSEQAQVRAILGENCDKDFGDVVKSLGKKRKPNFIRFGRSSNAEPNFLRFGKAKATSSAMSEQLKHLYRVGKRATKPTFLRFGRPDSDTPNFLRFGRDPQPNFLRFGKRKPNFLRFGRAAAVAASPGFDREDRKPNFLRFGKRAAE